MKILLTNDDGYLAKGIVLLQKRLLELHHDVWLVAPTTEQSGKSHSLTLFKELIATKINDKTYHVSGTPADSVLFAINELNNDYDLVISGINAGQNMGEDIFYSGTVAAATEACFQDIPAIAVSSCAYKEQNYITAITVIEKVIEKKLFSVLKRGEILNINVPSIPYNELKGYKLTRTGERHYNNFMHYVSRDDSKITYTVGGDKPDHKLDIKSDLYAVDNCYVSITHLNRKSPDSANFTLLSEIEKYEI